MRHPIPDTALDDRLFFGGTAGSGKTYNAMGRVERLLARHARVVIPDPLGVWWGLRLDSSGKAASGYDVVIFGGPHGDLPLTEHAGGLIGETVAGMKESCILDLSELGTKAAERRFMLAFLTGLYKHASGEPLHVVFDEADMWCLDAETEVLTDRGWKRHTQINRDDRAVCFDLASGTYRYGEIQRVIVKHFAGEMVHLKTKSLDCLATPDHRVVLRRVQRAKGRYGLYPWTFVPANKVPTCIAIPSGGAPIGNGVSDLSAQTCRVLGWVISDGCIHDKRKSARAVCIEQADSTSKMGKSIAAEMDAVLKTYPGVSVYRRGSRAEGHSPASRWYLGKKLSAVILHHLDGDIRRIPRSIILNGSVEQLSALYQGLLEGDGSSQDGVGWTHFYPGLDEGLADDFQELALRLGFGTTKRKVKGRNDFCVSIADKRSSSHWLRKPTRRRYDGVVWDITVPTGAFVARRNGRIFVTGNCPQRIMDREGDAAKLYGMMETIVRRGRIKGFIPWLISQRPAVISKDVLSQADGIVAFKLTSSQDRDAIGDWVQGQADKKTWAEIWSSLPTMERGQGVVWLPGRGVLDTVQFPVKETFDSSRTPKRGERSHRTAALRPIDLGKVKERLATVEAEVKANDPRALRVQLIEKDKVISELRNELTLKSTTAAPDKDAMRKAEERGFEQAKKKLTAAAQREAKEVLLSGMTAIRSHIGRLTADVDDELKKLRAANVDVGEMVTFTPSAPVQVVRAGPSPAAKPIRAAAAQRADGAIERPLQLIVDAIRWWNVMGIRAPSHAQVAFVAGYSHKSGTWATYLSRLRSLNYIEGRGDLVLTDHGSAVVNDPPEPPSGEQLRATVIAKIDAPLQKILRPILRAYPEALSHQVAGEQAGYSPSSGTWATYLSRLRSLDLIDGRGELRAQDWLFPSVPHLTSVSAR